jgi:hypothetical protein
MPETCNVKGCGAPATKDLNYILTFRGVRLPATAPVCDAHGDQAQAAGQWHTAKGEGPAIKFRGIGSQNSAFQSLTPIEG